MSDKLMRLTTEIVSSFVAKNHHRADELPDLIKSVFDALNRAETPAETPTAAETTKPTAQAVKKSVQQEYLVSFEDGKHYRTLRRHLAKRDLTPDAYRAKYGLGKDYPMTAAAYSAKRSELARSAGLGQQRRKDRQLEAAAETAPTLDDVAQDEAPARAGTTTTGRKTKKGGKRDQPTAAAKVSKKRVGRAVEAA